MIALFARGAWARALPRVTGLHRRLGWLFMELALPVVGTLAMVEVYRGLGAPQRFLGFAVLGGAMLAFWQNVLWSMAMQLYWDRSNGNLELFVMSPTSMVAVTMGMALGAIPLTAVRATAVGLAGSLLFHVHYAAGALLPALGIFLLTLACLYALGIVLGSLFLFYGRDAWHLATAMQEPVYLLSGLYFPVRSLGAFAGLGASLIPMTLGLDAMRQLLLPGSTSLVPLAVEVLVLGVQLVVMSVAAVWSLAFMERRARDGGRLVSRSV